MLERTLELVSFPRLYRFETVRLAMSNTRERSIGGPHDRSLVSTSLYSAIVDGIRSWGPMAALVILCLSFGLADPSFATFENLQTIASRAAIPVIIAVGMTFIIIQGSIDLSIEGVMAAASLTFAMSVLNTRTKLDLGFAGVLLGVIVGIGFGFVNGLIVTRFRVPSFMVTLGIWSISMGVAMLLSGGQPPLIS